MQSTDLTRGARPRELHRYRDFRDLDVSAVVQNFLSTTGGFGPIRTQAAGSTDGIATVTYTFTPIPEPTTALLLGGGLLGIAAAIRRKR